MKICDTIYEIDFILEVMRMNISEFAQKAGVSKSAVSRYFNKGYLSEDKRELIERAIEETGYAPSVSAQNVRTRVTKLIGVILPKLSSESCARITEGIGEILNKKGYELLLVNTSNDCRKEIEYLELFRQNRVDGVILLASMFTPMHERVLHKMRIPVVIVGQSHKGFCCVCHDDYGASYALTKLMLEKGSKDPAYIGVTDEDKAAGLARHNGFLKAMEEAGIKISLERQATAEFTLESGYENAKRIFAHKPYPDSIFCATDNIAVGVMLYCRENKINVPNEVMISAVGDSVVGRMSAITLTSVHLHYKTSGREAARMLLASIDSGEQIPRTMQLDYEIIERESTERNVKLCETDNYN